MAAELELKTKQEALSEVAQKFSLLADCDRWMVGIWRVVDGKLLQNKVTWEFLDADLEKAASGLTVKLKDAAPEPLKVADFLKMVEENSPEPNEEAVEEVCDE